MAAVRGDNPFVAYYRNQATGRFLQTGGSFTGNVFKGRFRQHGSGITSSIARFFRNYVSPIAINVGKHVGQHLLTNAMNFGDDIVSGRANFRRDVRQRLANVGKETAGIALKTVRSQLGMGRLPNALPRKRRADGKRGFIKKAKGAVTSKAKLYKGKR